VRAIFDASAGNPIDNLGIQIDDANRRDHLGSAFQDGFYGHVQKDLRTLLGQPVTRPFSRVYCGGGVLAACKAVLWSTLSQAAVDLTAEFGNASVTSWQRQIADEDIRHTAAGITTVPAIDWQNRPTFQQVVQIPVGLCGTAPSAGCKTPIAPGTSQIQLKNRAIDTQDRIGWKWNRGRATSLAEFGDPDLVDVATTSASSPARARSRGRPHQFRRHSAAAGRARLARRSSTGWTLLASPRPASAGLLKRSRSAPAPDGYVRSCKRKGQWRGPASPCPTLPADRHARHPRANGEQRRQVLWEDHTTRTHRAKRRRPPESEERLTAAASVPAE
jgi:hypothetical protein